MRRLDGANFFIILPLRLANDLVMLVVQLGDFLLMDDFLFLHSLLQVLIFLADFIHLVLYVLEKSLFQLLLQLLGRELVFVLFRVVFGGISFPLRLVQQILQLGDFAFEFVRLFPGLIQNLLIIRDSFLGRLCLLVGLL